MHSSHTEPHYAPSSVGALMDPEFLRKALRDSGEMGFPSPPPPSVAMARWRSTLQAAFQACWHRFSSH